MEPFRFHIFVCTQQKPEGVASCDACGSGAVLESLDGEIRALGIADDVQVTTCGCMGLCDEGPVLVVYPEGLWYRRVHARDVPEIVDRHLSRGEPVERLMWDDALAMKAMSVEHGEKFRAAMSARDKAGILPDRFEQMIRGFMPSRCILTALELDLFSAVGSGASAERVAAKIGADGRATATLLNALAALGMMVKSGGKYTNTPQAARFFAQGSPDNQRNGLLHTANIWHRWSTLTKAVRNGRNVPVDRADSGEWTQNFISAMHRNAKTRAPLVVEAVGVEGVHRILDLGGGSGIYSIAFAHADSDIHCDILDVPEVVPLTSEYVSKSGVQAQISVRAGNMLHDDFGSGYDVVMLNAICHMFSEGENKELFRRARRALAPNGRLVVQDFILNPEKTGPLHAVLFSLNMLVGTAGGASWSEPEYTEWMEEADFAEVTRHHLPGPSDLMIGRAS